MRKKLKEGVKQFLHNLCPSRVDFIQYFRLYFISFSNTYVVLGKIVDLLFLNAYFVRFVHGPFDSLLGFFNILSIETALVGVHSLDALIGTSHSGKSVGVDFFLAGVEVVVLFFGVIFDFYFELVADVGKAGVGGLESADCGTAHLFFAAVVMLSIALNLFLLLAVFLFDLIPVGFGVVGSLALLMGNGFNIFFILQIQKHRLLFVL